MKIWARCFKKEEDILIAKKDDIKYQSYQDILVGSTFLFHVIAL